MPRTRFPPQVVARIWDYLRKTFKIDWSKIKKKSQIQKAINTRKKFLQSVISYKRTIRGVSPSEARKELSKIEEGEKNLRTGKPSVVYRRTWYQIKPLAKKTSYIKSYRARGTTIKGHTRDRMPWTNEQKRFVAERRGMKTRDLMNSFNQTFGTARSYKSIAMKKHKIKV